MYFNRQALKQRYFTLFSLLVGVCSVALLGIALGEIILSAEVEPVAPEQVRQETGEWIPELPVRLVIPTIGVDASVQPVGLDESGSGEMAVPSNFTDVGWYEPGVRPGMDGSAVIAGHYNGKGIPEAVFFDLASLDVGDEIVIMSETRVEDIFTVVAVRTYEYDEPADEVFESDDGIARLNLITCGGNWLKEERRFDTRTVVFAELLTDVE